MGIFDYIPEIHWNRKTGEISFMDVNRTHWRGKGTIRILKRLPDGVEIEIQATVQGIVKYEQSKPTGTIE